MTITTTTLTRAAGLSAVAGGLLFIAVQINHPLLDADLHHHDRVRGPRNHEDLDGRPVADRHHRDLPAPGQADRSARPDRVPRVRRRLSRHPQHPGRRRVRPAVPGGQPARLRQRRPRGGHRRHADRRHRRAAAFIKIGGFTYLAGGIIFGIALFRAGVLARWAAALLAVGAVATVATFLLPQLNQRLFAIPVGVALIGLGYSLWREQRTAPLARCPARPVPSSTRLTPDDHPARYGPRVPRAATGGCRRLVALVVLPAFFGSLRWSSWPAVRS